MDVLVSHEGVAPEPLLLVPCEYVALEELGLDVALGTFVGCFGLEGVLVSILEGGLRFRRLGMTLLHRRYRRLTVCWMFPCLVLTFGSQEWGLFLCIWRTFALGDLEVVASCYLGPR